MAVSLHLPGQHRHKCYFECPLIYWQLITDRFAIANDTALPCDTSARQYCGGTWEGIVNHLDYIQGMGFDAIWISPVAENVEGQTSSGAAFHGYWTKDLLNLNTNFGTAEDLKALSKALHDRNMFLMFGLWNLSWIMLWEAHVWFVIFLRCGREPFRIADLNRQLLVYLSLRRPCAVSCPMLHQRLQ